MMKKLLSVILAFLAIGVFVQNTLKNSKDCNQFVIDGYEIHSRIDIPEVHQMDCYYDQRNNIRVSVYYLLTDMNLEKFTSSYQSISPSFRNTFLNLDQHPPSDRPLLAATGKRWGKSWTYVIDPDSNRLWTGLVY